MTPERWQRMDSLYDAAAEMEAADRARFLAEQCADDESLRRELEAMFDGRGSDFTEIVGSVAAVAFESDRWTGRRMGPYRIVRAIGRGGMGAVFLAVRDDDEYKKEVAVKTLKFDAGDPAMLSRFRHERQILAHLEHPNIARLLDGGTTPEGTPYIVLEYVAGVPINEYCEEQGLSIDQRLKLFRQVCDAVQYAHQHLVVHRDLKPANILVTPEGAPKLLDFGIAKLLTTGDLDSDEPATATGAMLLTPDYSSPEQVRGAEISTATDIYSLGAVLYQMLTGQRPYSIRNYDPIEIARVVCDAEVRPPSELGNRRLRGDLDVIVLKAMQKEPARRYRSVEEFSEDIRRYLEGMPITARPDAAAYRVAKFVSRHRAGVVAVVAVVAALTAGLAVALHEASVAQRRFAQVRELANTFLFKFYDQVTPLPGSTAVRASIVETSRKYLDGLASDAGNDKGLLLELAQAYQRLGNVQAAGHANLDQLEDARRNYQRSLDLYTRLGVNAKSSESLRTKAASLLESWAWAEMHANHEDRAEPIFRRMREVCTGGEQTKAILNWLGRSEYGLGEVDRRKGRIREALSMLRSAHDRLRGLVNAGYAQARALADEVDSDLARTKVLTGDLDGALADFQELLRTAPPCNEQAPVLADCYTFSLRLSWMAPLYWSVSEPNLGEPAKAQALYERLIRLLTQYVAQDPNNRSKRYELVNATGSLGDALWESDPKRALELYDRALTLSKSLVSQEEAMHIRGSYLISISRPLIKLRRLTEARAALTELRKIDAAEPATLYLDQFGDIQDEALWAPLLLAEGKRGEAKQSLARVIEQMDALRRNHPEDFTLVFFISRYCRQLALLSGGEERRQALLRSAAVWHSWPATSFTRREEDKDRQAAK